MEAGRPFRRLPLSQLRVVSGEQDVRTGGKDKGARTENEEQEGVRNEEREFGLGCFHLELLPGHPGKSSSVIGSLGPKLQK